MSCLILQIKIRKRITVSMNTKYYIIPNIMASTSTEIINIINYSKTKPHEKTKIGFIISHYSVGYAEKWLASFIKLINKNVFTIEVIYIEDPLKTNSSSVKANLAIHMNDGQGDDRLINTTKIGDDSILISETIHDTGKRHQYSELSVIYIGIMPMVLLAKADIIISWGCDLDEDQFSRVFNLHNKPPKIIIVPFGSKSVFIRNSLITKYHVFPCQATLKYVCKSIFYARSPNHETIIYGGVDKSHLMKQKGSLSRSDFPTVTDDTFIVGYIGKIERKTTVPLEILVDVIGGISASSPTTLILMGDKTINEDFCNSLLRRSKTNSVQFVSHEHHEGDFYRLCDCIVIPDSEKTFNAVAMECVAVGTPFISTETGFLGDLNESHASGYYKLPSPVTKENLAKAIGIMSAMDPLARKIMLERCRDSLIATDTFTIQKNISRWSVYLLGFSIKTLFKKIFILLGSVRDSINLSPMTKSELKKFPVDIDFITMGSLCRIVDSTGPFYYLIIPNGTSITYSGISELVRLRLGDFSVDPIVKLSENIGGAFMVRGWGTCHSSTDS